VVTSPSHRNRLGVGYPSRVLSGSEVAALSVLRSRFGLGARRALGPSGLPSSTRAQGRDSLGDPLVGFHPPSRFVNEPPSPHSRTMTPLLGFRSPSALEEEGGHVRPACAGSAPRVFASGLDDGSHPADYGAAHRFSQPHSGVVLPPPSRPISDG